MSDRGVVQLNRLAYFLPERQLGAPLGAWAELNLEDAAVLGSFATLTGKLLATLATIARPIPALFPGRSQDAGTLGTFARPSHKRKSAGGAPAQQP
jgi:hypothetical protein